jgi:HK97 family phage portal protein
MAEKNFLQRIFSKRDIPVTNTDSPVNTQDLEKRDNFNNGQYFDPVMASLGFGSYPAYNQTMGMKLSTVWKCVNTISNGIAILPLENFQIKNNWRYKQNNDLDFLLNCQPNSRMSAFDLKHQFVQDIICRGNGDIKINRDKNFNVKSLELLDSNFIQVWAGDMPVYWNSIMFDGELTYHNLRTGEVLDAADVITCTNYTQNGLVGISTISAAAQTLGIAQANDSHAYGFSQGGGNMAGILTPTDNRNIGHEKAQHIRESFQNVLQTNPNSIIALEAGLTYQPISISPRDSQLLESRQFDMVTIAQWFGVPLAKIGYAEKSNYASVEASQIDFLNSTLHPLIEKIENEFKRKIFSRVEIPFKDILFNTEQLLRVDAKSQAEYFTKLFGDGVYSPNDIRQRLNCENPIKNGNRYFVPVNVQPIDNLFVDAKSGNNNGDVLVAPPTLDNQMK